MRGVKGGPTYYDLNQFPRTTNKIRPDATFDPEMYKKAIQGKTLNFHWSRGVFCPCRTPTTENPDPTCIRCIGSGWWYVNPYALLEREVPTKAFTEIQAVFAEVTVELNQLETAGHLPTGRGVLTVQSETPVGFHDRFAGVDQEMVWSELVTRGPDLVPVGKAGRTSEEQVSALRYEPAVIHYLADNETIYWPQEDYEIREATDTEPARLEWLEDRGPATGVIYAIHYTCRPIWIVESASHAMQHLFGPERGMKGNYALQRLPTSFRVLLDYMTDQVGT